MRLVTGKQQKALDAYLIQRGIPIELLMEAAGSAVAAKAAEVCPPGAKVDLFIGPGMNGGDLYVTARKLRARGLRPRVFEMREAEAKASELVRTMRGAAAACGVPFFALEDFTPEDGTALAADGLLGTGFDPSRPLSAELQAGFAGLAACRAAGAKILACDLPSGVSADWGTVHEAAVPADYCVTFITPKTGQMQSPACQYNGKLTVADLELPAALYDDFLAAMKEDESGPEAGPLGGVLGRLTPPEHVTIMHPHYFSRFLKDVRSDTHKGTQGHALLVSGQQGMAGAARLSGEAALRSGTGLVTLLSSESVYRVVFPLLPSLLYKVVADDRPEAWLETLKEKRKAADAVLLGPGLGLDEKTEILLRELLNWEQPLVLDADALTVLAGLPDAVELTRARAAAGHKTVLTPHMGEAARLARAAAEDQAAFDAWHRAPRLKQAMSLAACFRAVVALKGEATLIASPEGKVHVNTTGGPGLAKGGSGDVLAGLLTGLAAQNKDIYEAARLAVYWHGLAGDLAAETLSWRAMSPVDTLESLGFVSV